MKQRSSKILSFALVAVFIGLTVGCANTQEISNLKQQLQAVEATASQAASQSEEAKATADAAMSAAEEAKVLAEDSAACCTATNEKLNRMFNQVQQK
ncbi:MAG: Lpp/OprI family alanine-zipper lipoprotein [Pseudomonadota bacterium]